MSDFESINWGELMKQSGAASEPLPIGKYSVIVTDCIAGQSSTQKLMYKLKLAVEGGPYNGRTLYNNITLTTDNPNALRMFFQNMKSLGLTDEFFAQNPSPSVVADVIRGQRCVVTVEHRMYNGNMTENVKAMSAPIAGINVGGIVPSISMVPSMGPSMVPSGPQIPTPGNHPSAPSTPGIPTPGIPGPGSSPNLSNIPNVPNIPAPVNPAPAAPVASAPPMEMPAPMEMPTTPAADAGSYGVSDAEKAAFAEFQAQKAKNGGPAATDKPVAGGPPPMVF